MNKLIKLIIVNLLGLFDINKIRIAREDGVKSNFEKKAIITGIIAVVYGFLIYQLFILLNISDKTLILDLGFIVSTIICLCMNMTMVEPLIFKNQDNDMLFSYPVTRHQILFSKLFVVYLRNLVFTSIVMIASVLSYNYFVKDISETFLMMYILGTLVIPFIPIVIATILSYINDYYKLKSGNNLNFKLFKLGLLLIFVGIIGLVFNNIRTQDINRLLGDIIYKFYYIYPLSYLFINSLVKESIISFIGLIFIPVIVIYLYTLFISNNYLRICSLLKGIKKKNNFELKKVLNMKKVFGVFRKEIYNLFNNKLYLNNSYGIMVVFSILLFIVLSVFDISSYSYFKYYDIYLNLYTPTLLCLFVTISGSTISAMSLEKSNIQMIGAMPISIEKLLIGKWLVNIFIGSIFVIINGSIVWYFLDLNKWGVIFSYLVPFVALLFVSYTSLLLDYRFIEKNEQDDNSIIKQRFISIVPMFLAVIISVGPFFIPVYKQYRLVLGSYVLAMIILMFIERIYLLVNKNKLRRNLFN